MSHREFTFGVTSVLFLAMSVPALAASSDLSLLCTGTADCVISTNTTIGTANTTLNVGGNFIINPGVILEFRVPVRIRVEGNMVLSGTLGAPGDGGDGGVGGASGQPGGAGGGATAVASAIFDVRGAISINSSAIAVTEGGQGGSGGAGGVGQIGGAGGTGGAAGSLSFNTCNSFSSASGAQMLVNGGSGGTGQTGALGGIGGAAGTVAINAKQAIVSHALVTALGGAGGPGGAGTGVNGADGTILLTSGATITVGTNTLNSGVNTPASMSNQSSISALSFCLPPTVSAVSPSSGSIKGGTIISLTGTGFTGATSVTVGGVPCASVTVVSPTSITCTTPPGTSEGASIAVTTPSGTSVFNTLFSYLAMIPTLSEWATLLMTFLIACIAFWRMRRR